MVGEPVPSQIPTKRACEARRIRVQGEDLDLVGYITIMVTKRTAQLMHLDADKAKLLAELAAETRVPKSVLMREAIDDLLVKHGKVKPPRRKT